MSTTARSTHTSLTCAISVALLVASCERERVSYAKLDAPWVDPASANDSGSVMVGALSNVSGPRSEDGRAFELALRRSIAEIDARGGVNGRPLEVSFLDDCGTEAGARAAARRLESVQRAIVIFAHDAGGSRRATDESAPRTPIVYVQAGPLELSRAGTFALESQSSSSTLDARTALTAQWVAAAFARAKTYGADDVLAALRTTPAPPSCRVREGGSTPR